MQLTILERRTLLDLIDIDHSRDQRMFDLGRTTSEVFTEQCRLYSSLRFKLVAHIPTADQTT